jgi:integrase
LAESYLEHAEQKKAASTIESDRSRIEKYIIPRLGKLDVGKVTRAHVRSFARWVAGEEPKAEADKPSRKKAKKKEGGKVTANRAVALLRVMYAYAEDVLDLELRNPAARIGKLYTEEPRARVLTDDELRAIWTGLDNAAALKVHMSEPLKLAIKGLMLTLQRAGELAGADAHEIDFKGKTWTLPANRTKNRRAHVVPLSAAALGVFTDAHEIAERPKRGPIFPTPKGRRQSMTAQERAAAAKPITRHAITRAMSRLCATLGIDDATPHDLRRTGATLMASERLGVSRYIVSRCLNHTSDLGGAAAVTASTYARGDDLPAKRAALDSWARLLLEIVSGEQQGADNVVTLRGAIEAG